MRFARVIERILTRLGSIPGLSFLGGYVVAAKLSHTRFGQRKGDYEAYVSNIGSVGGEIRDAARGSRGDEGEEGPEADELEDPSSNVYDWYDDYEQSSDGAAGGGGSAPLDDYPASDENTSYFDDDYRR